MLLVTLVVHLRVPLVDPQKWSLKSVRADSVCLSVIHQLFSETTGPIAMKFGRNHLDRIPQGGFSHFFDIALRCLATG